jgi:hypothetical protein
LGINTTGKTAEELTLLYGVLPNLEAYYELLHRNANTQIAPERLAKLVKLASDEEVTEEQLDEIYAEAKFASTPL